MGSSYDDWTVHQLKWALKERDLPVSGNKHKLIERLESSPEEKTELAFSDFEVDMDKDIPLGVSVVFFSPRKWIPLFFSNPKTTLLNRILISITFFPGIIFLFLTIIYFYLYIGTSFWDFEIKLFGFRESKLLGILFILYAVFFGSSMIIWSFAMKDVFIKIENERVRAKEMETRKEAEQSITKLKDTIDRLKSKGIDTTDLERVLAECEAEMGAVTESEE